MGRPAKVHYTSLRTCLCNLPLAIHGPLAQRAIAPQSVVVELTFRPPPEPASSGSTEPSPARSDPIKAYLGWSGFPSQVGSVSVGRNGTGAGLSEVVEVDPQVGALVGLGPEASQVTIELLRDLPSAVSVSVSPLSTDDWEILETNAAFVEMNLLSQVRAVREGMVVCCWVGTTIVRFTIDATSPAPTPSSPCVVLTNDTELLVAPKSRASPPKPRHVAPRASDAPTDPKWDALHSRLVRLLPPHAAQALGLAQADAPGPAPPHANGVGGAHANGAGGAHANGSGQAHDGDDDDDVAYVAPTLHARMVECLGDEGRCGAMWWPMPTLEAAERERKDEQDRAEGRLTESEERSKKRIEVRIRPSDKVPAEHVWMGERLRTQLAPVGGWPNQAGFELVKFGSPLSSAERKQRSKEARDKDRQDDKDKAKEADKATSKLKLPIHPPPSTSASAPHLMTAQPAAPSRPLAGVAEQTATITTHVAGALLAHRIGQDSAPPTPAPGIILSGLAGAGKTALVMELAKALETDKATLTHTVYRDCNVVADEPWPKQKEMFKAWVDEAWWHAPSLLVLDNLDKMVTAEQEHTDSFPALHLAHLFVLAVQPALAARPIVLLATVRDASALHPHLSTSHLMGITIPLRGPNKNARRDILVAVVRDKAEGSEALAFDGELNWGAVATETEGYLPVDLKALVDRAIIQAAIKRSMKKRQGQEQAQAQGALVVRMDDFLSAQKDFVPLSLQGVKLQTSTTEWADIGGLAGTKATLRETLEWPTKYAQIFAGCPLRLRSGLLLYGFPGCGKTLLASAVAKECGLNFIAVKGPEILNKYIGASEKSVRDLFDRARAARPCVLFFDEFDAIAPKRGHDSTGVTDRVVNQMLTEMDGAEGLEGVYVLAATSRPDLIDGALLRPGRLDKSLECGMPTRQEREEILRACCRKVHLSSDVDLAEYVDATAGFSGADLQAVVYNAHLEAIQEGRPKVDLTQARAGDGPGPGTEGEELFKLTYVEVGGKAEPGGAKVRSAADEAKVRARYETILKNYRAQQAAKSQVPPGSQVAEDEAQAKPERPTTSIHPRHFAASLRTTRPSVPQDEVVRLGRIYDDFVGARSKGGLPNGEASGEVGGRVSLM